MTDHNNEKHLTEDSESLVVELIHEEKRSDLETQDAKDNAALNLNQLASKVPRKGLIIMKEVLEKFSLRFK